ncbi:MAG: MFS transporter, partial [Desulfobacterales bacterium]|nr:MFS transporter [Desulfobacterales bacterium]
MSKKGWLVTFSGTGLNLALGTLYAWSVFGKQFTEAIDKGGFGWSKTAAAMPYSIAIGVFALMMIPAGRLQDKLGPGIIATIGAILMAAGMIVTSLSTPGNALPAIIGFGILAGTGIGFGYASATPAAVKWFPPEKKGLIAGIVVAGFGLASVYVAPVSQYLLGSYGVGKSFLILGIAFGIVTLIVTRFIKNPPSPVAAKPNPAQAKAAPASQNDYTWTEMMKTPTFYLLWLEFT